MQEKVSQEQEEVLEIRRRFEFAKTKMDAVDDLLLSKFSQPSQIRMKDDEEIVTDVDFQVQDIFVNSIAQRFPNDIIVSEEMSPDEKQVDFQTKDVWVIDPLDGTANFVRGDTMFSCAVSFIRNGVTRFGVVSAPRRKERYSSILGGKAFLNQAPIRVKQVHKLSECVIATGFPKTRDEEMVSKLLKRLGRVLHKAYDIRRTGSPCLDICQVACGRLDGFYEELYPWDYSAGSIIATQAGAISINGPNRVTSLSKKRVCIAHPNVIQDLIDCVSFG